MIDLKKRYSFDKELAKTGAKMVIGPDPDTDYLLVRRTPSEEYYRVLSETLQNSGDKLEELKKTNPEEAKKLDLYLQCEVMAKTVVVGFGPGIEENGSPLEFSVESCAKLLSEYDDLRVEVTIFSRNNANFPPKMDVEKVKKR